MFRQSSPDVSPIRFATISPEAAELKREEVISNLASPETATLLDEAATSTAAYHSMANLHQVVASRPFQLQNGAQIIHDRVVDHYIKKISADSCLPAPVNKIRYALRGLTVQFSLYVVAIIFCMGFDAVGAWKNHYDRDHYSDGAPPEISQQNKDYEQALRNICLIFAFTFLGILALSTGIYYTVDERVHMNGYKEFSAAMLIPRYNPTHSTDLLRRLEELSEFLLKYHSGYGAYGIAYMLGNLQEVLIDSEDAGNSERSSSPRIEHHNSPPMVSLPHTPARFSPPRDNGVGIGSFSPTQPHLTPALSESTGPAPFTTTATGSPLLRNYSFREELERTEQRKKASFSAALPAAEDADLTLKSHADGYDVYSRHHPQAVRNIGIITTRNDPRFQQMEERLRNIEQFLMNLDGTSGSHSRSVLQPAAPSDLSERVNQLEQRIQQLAPTQNVGPQLQQLNQQLQEVKQLLTHDRHHFMALLMSCIREKMSLDGINTSIKYRARLLQTLLQIPYFSDHHHQLSHLIRVFFTYAYYAQTRFKSEHEQDKNTFLALTPHERETIINLLEQHPVDGSEQLEQDLRTLHQHTQLKPKNWLQRLFASWDKQRIRRRLATPGDLSAEEVADSLDTLLTSRR